MKTEFKVFCLVLLLMCSISFNALSQLPPLGVIKVIVSPDHKDWTYKLNEEAKFTVRIMKNGNLADNVTIDYETGPETLPDVIKKGVLLKDGTMEFSGTMKEPGFFRVIVWAYVDGKRYEGLATAGFEPEKITPVVKEPADFDAFWTKAIADARKINLDPVMTLVPERCTSEANVYHISFQNDKPGSKIYGMLAVPKKPGKYPALLKVPGGGVYRYGGDTRIAASGIITLEIGIHGIPVNLDPQVYTDLYNGALSNYFTIKMNDRDAFYFKRVYLGCVKAVDFIFTLPEFNGKNIAVTGQSQGGMLSIVTAALDRRIEYLAPIYPGGCDNARYLVKKATLSPSGYRYKEAKPGEIETLGYFDVVNFARRISIPGFYSWGYNDVVCTPTSMYAAFNVISAKKELHLYPETGHWTYPEEQEAVYNWLIKQLKDNSKTTEPD
ncbi:MAG: acetylxylan esterase [Bacteroidia bacterium]|nr:acetylxylan esterase [Bacteroidia bacterium]